MTRGLKATNHRTLTHCDVERDINPSALDQRLQSIVRRAFIVSHDPITRSDDTRDGKPNSVALSALLELAHIGDFHNHLPIGRDIAEFCAKDIVGITRLLQEAGELSHFDSLPVVGLGLLFLLHHTAQDSLTDVAGEAHDADTII